MEETTTLWDLDFDFTSEEEEYEGKDSNWQEHQIPIHFIKNMNDRDRETLEGFKKEDEEAKKMFSQLFPKDENCNEVPRLNIPNKIGFCPVQNGIVNWDDVEKIFHLPLYNELRLVQEGDTHWILLPPTVDHQEINK